MSYLLAWSLLSIIVAKIFKHIKEGTVLLFVENSIYSVIYFVNSLAEREVAPAYHHFLSNESIACK